MMVNDDQHYRKLFGIPHFGQVRGSKLGGQPFSPLLGPSFPSFPLSPWTLLGDILNFTE